MKKFIRNFVKQPLSILLLALPLTLLGELLGWSALWIFILAALGIIPLAAYTG